MSSGWIGVDLDGTLARYPNPKGFEEIGDIIEPMKQRILNWLAKDITVKIMTARVSGAPDESLYFTREIQVWLVKNGLPALEVTCKKDYAMLELYDDRAIQVEMNTGRLIGHSTRNL